VQEPSTGGLLTQWDWEPSILIGIALLSAGYAYAIGPLRRKHGLGPPAQRGRIVLFVLAQLTLVLALLSPIDEIGDEYLFSAHMVQHLLLSTLWPPLLLLSLPDWLVRPLFQRGWFSAIASFLTLPAIAIILFNVDVYLWHIPGLYDATLENQWVHIAEHLSFMGFGVLNWWPVLSPLREQRLSYPLQILYLFADGMFMMVLGIVFTFSPTVFYSPYLTAPRLWGLSPLTDQQLGGLIMWYPGNLPYGVLLIVAFYRWFEGGEATRSQSPTIGPHLP
jgi:putative membrane protein